MAQINTGLILAAIENGEDFTIPGISKKMLAYVRCWANRKGLYVSYEEGNATISKENRRRLRTDLFEELAKNSGDFFVKIEPGQIQYLRNLVSEFNRTHPDGPRWHASQELTFPEKKPVIADDGKLGFVIFADHK
jgi:hypothetical protein